MKWVWCWPALNKQKVRLFIAACRSCTLALMRDSVVQMHYHQWRWWRCLRRSYATIILIPALHWSLLIDCMARVLCWPPVDEQKVRLYCYVWLGIVIGVRCSVGAMSRIVWFYPHGCAILLSEYTTMLITVVHRSSSLVECMKWVWCWPDLNNQHVRLFIAACRNCAPSFSMKSK